MKQKLAIIMATIYYVVAKFGSAMPDDTQILPIPSIPFHPEYQRIPPMAFTRTEWLHNLRGLKKQTEPQHTSGG